MTDFLLVHGGCHGAWCWENLQEELDRIGHRGHAFDLPGAGNDSTPRHTVSRSDYLDATVKAIDAVDADRLVIVGHSIAGSILPEVARERPGRLAGAAFLAAVVLDRGEATIDLIPADRRPRYFAEALADPESCLLPGYEEARDRYFGDLDEDEARRCYERLTPQPLAPYLEPAEVSAKDIGCPRTYVLCTRDRTFPEPHALAMAEKLDGAVQRLPSDHDPMLSHPEELARLLGASSAN